MNLQNQVPFFVSSLYAPILHLFLRISAIAVLFHKIPTIHFPSLYSVAEIYKFLIHLIDQLVCSSSTHFQELLHFLCVHKYLVHISPSFIQKWCKILHSYLELGRASVLLACVQTVHYHSVLFYYNSSYSFY